MHLLCLEVSMFKVGDKVVYRNQCSTIWDGVYIVDAVLTNGDVIERDCQTPKEWLSQATPQEIAAGHRIDKCKCVATRTYENGMCNKCGLHDMGDDSHIENHISKNCKVIDYE